jgi:hypothetical protein
VPSSSSNRSSTSRCCCFSISIAFTASSSREG